MRYRSDIRLGEKYRDKHTGIEGVAIAVVFFEHACERVTIRYAHDGDVKENSFDAAELQRITTGKTPQVTKTGGARPMPSARSGPVR